VADVLFIAGSAFALLLWIFYCIEHHVVTPLRMQVAEWQDIAQRHQAQGTENARKILARHAEDRARWTKAYGPLCLHQGKRQCSKFCQNRDCLLYDPHAAYHYFDWKKNGWKVRRALGR
jgi:hypothetical protein